MYLVALVALAAIGAGAVYLAVRTDPNQLTSQKAVTTASDLPVLAASVPSLDGNKGWLNSPPLSPGDVTGKVVLYDFWTYSCVNCLRTIPHLEALYAAYHAKGLEIVGIHSPEFDFEKDHGNVTKAVHDLGISWPVAFDDDMAVWSSFGNEYWPEEYLADQQGRIRSVHFGEGDYDQKEDEVRALLGLDASTPRATVAPDQTPTQAVSPEMHFGTKFDAALYCSSPEGYRSNDAFTIPSDQPNDTFALEGKWTIDDQGATASDGAALALRYHAGDVNIVLSSAAASGQVDVELDGQPLTTLHVDAAKLYNVVTSGPSGYHTLVFRPEAGAHITAYAFTFGT